MKDKGFIVLYRDIFDWEWFDDVYVFKLFVCLIMLASHEAKRYKGKTLKRGSFITSIASLSQKVKMSETSVKNSLKKLSATGEIEQEIIPNKYRIITIKNYNKFQSVGFSKTDNKTDSKTNNKTNSKTDRKTNNKTTINNENKCVCLTDTHTQQENNAAAPRALEERGHAAVTWNEIRQYQIDNHIGGGEIVDDFYDAFHESNTRFPENWQQVYTRFARADYPEQDEFVRRLKSGDYHSKWGKVDAGA